MSHRRKNPDRLTEAPPVDPVPLPPAAPPDPPAVPGAFEAAWERRVAQALDMIDRGINATQPLGMEPDEFRARMVAVKLVIGAQPSALPRPTRQALRLGELEIKDGDKTTASLG